MCCTCVNVLQHALWWFAQFWWFLVSTWVCNGHSRRTIQELGLLHECILNLWHPESAYHAASCCCGVLVSAHFLTWADQSSCQPVNKLNMCKARFCVSQFVKQKFPILHVAVKLHAASWSPCAAPIFLMGLPKGRLHLELVLTGTLSRIVCNFKCTYISMHVQYVIDALL